MAVKPVQAVTRALAVLDAVAQHEPVGVAALARIVGEGTSAVQRALVSLHDAGWIRTAPGSPVRWELSLRVFALGARAAGRSGLRERARPLLESLRESTGESAFLVEVDDGRLVVIDVVESHQVVRAAPALGLALPVARSASGFAVLAHLDDDGRERLLGAPVDAELADELTTVAQRGWSVSAGLVGREQTSVGAAVLDGAGRSIGALVVTGPRDRVPPKLQKAYGTLVAQAAVTLTAA
jgi:IclR family acetate operon transcriptional repressor